MFSLGVTRHRLTSPCDTSWTGTFIAVARQYAAQKNRCIRAGWRWLYFSVTAPCSDPVRRRGAEWALTRHSSRSCASYSPAHKERLHCQHRWRTGADGWCAASACVSANHRQRTHSAQHATVHAVCMRACVIVYVCVRRTVTPYVHCTLYSDRRPLPDCL